MNLKERGVPGVSGPFRIVFIVVLAALFSLDSRAETQSAAPTESTSILLNPVKRRDWVRLWESNILSDARNRYCDREMGEEIGWMMTPFVDGFYEGYLATHETSWIDRLVDWTDAWVKRGVKEPDGCIGWPKAGAASTDIDNLRAFNTDSFLGEAMLLRPIVLMSAEILRDPALKQKYGAKAQGYLKLSTEIYQKWDARGCWRETADGGMISVVLPYGLDAATGQWTTGYANRNAAGQGFSHPNNKANIVACWLLAMSDATGQPVYRERAARWFRILKSRMKVKADSNTYVIWNYWEPAGAWDGKPNGSPKHWVGVHPNAGYYEIDAEGIVEAYEHGVVFTKEDIDRLIATALAEKRYWGALAPYNAEIQKRVEQTLKPDSWGCLSAAPALLLREMRK